MNRTGEIKINFNHQLFGKGARVLSHTSWEERDLTGGESGENQAQMKKEKNWSEIKRLQRWQVENVNSCGYHGHNSIRLKLHSSSILCSEEKAD